MAITRTDYDLFRRLRELGQVPSAPSLLEIGEAEFYGDVPIDDLLRDVAAFCGEAEREELTHSVMGLVRRIRAGWVDGVHHTLAKIVYRAMFAAMEISAIDLHGTPNALQLDLNFPMGDRSMPRKRDIVYNTGTAEHVFRIGGVLEFIHDAAANGGLMIHCFPFTGLIDHGFYSIQPTLVRDLARANGYEILHWAVGAIGGPATWLSPSEAVAEIHGMARAGTLPENAWHFVAYRKGRDEPFRVPMQHIYGGGADAATVAGWRDMR